MFKLKQKSKKPFQTFSVPFHQLFTTFPVLKTMDNAVKT